MGNIDRREFLKLVGAGGVGVGSGFMLAESIKHPVEYLIPSVVPPEDFSPGVVTWYNTVCSMCQAGCGISVRTREGRAKKIEGNPAHPVSQGRSCARGQASLQLLYNPDRLIAPMARAKEGNGELSSTSDWQPITWDNGLNRVSQQIQQLTEDGRADSICFLSKGVRGHLAKLIEQFMAQLGSPRLLHYDFAHPHNLYAANQRFYGEQVLPYYDLANCRYLLSFGADYLANWISPVHHSLGFSQSRQGQGNLRGQFVQIEPRMSLSGAAADEWIAAKPGTEGLLAMGLAHLLVKNKHYQGEDLDRWTESLRLYPPDWVAEQTAVPVSTLIRLAETFASKQPSLAIAGESVSNHSNGSDALVAINALNYLAGNVGQAGGVVFNPHPVTTPDATNLPQARQASYQQLLAFVEDANQGKIQLLILNDSNPVFSLPTASHFKEALAKIPLIVSLSPCMDETTAMADLILPGHTALESWGDDFPEPGVGFPVGSLSQPVVSPLYNTRACGDIVLALAQRLDFSGAMPWPDMKAYLQAGWRDIYKRSSPSQQAEGFESFWRAVLQAGVWGEKSRRDNDYFVPDAQVVAKLKVQAPEFSGAEADFPFVLQPYLSSAFHDGRSANLPWMQELPDPLTSVVYGSWLELNPTTAADLDLTEGDLVTIESIYGSITAPVLLYPAIRPEVVAMPIGQGHTDYGRYASNRGSNPLEILAPLVELSTGNLACNATRVKLQATGQRLTMAKTGGQPRQLGREIIQTTADSDHAVRIPMKEV